MKPHVCQQCRASIPVGAHHLKLQPVADANTLQPPTYLCTLDCAHAFANATAAAAKFARSGVPVNNAERDRHWEALAERARQVAAERAAREAARKADPGVCAYGINALGAMSHELNRTVSRCTLPAAHRGECNPNGGRVVS